jgi:hypothetical protein
LFEISDEPRRKPGARLFCRIHEQIDVADICLFSGRDRAEYPNILCTVFFGNPKNFFTVFT